MKKSLITLLALGGLAMGAEEVLTLAHVDVTANPNLSTVTSSYGLEKSTESWTLSKSTTDALTGDGDYKVEDLRPEVNVGNGGTWSLTFSLTNNGTTTLTVNQITLDMFTFASNGWSQGSNTPRYFDFTLTDELDTQFMTSVDSNTEESDYKIDGNSNPKGQASECTSQADFELKFDQSVDIQAGDTQKFVLTVMDGSVKYGDDGSRIADGTYVGLSTMKIQQVVPEPTTATLSLLALAALAARRRRK